MAKNRFKLDTICISTQWEQKENQHLGYYRLRSACKAPPNFPSDESAVGSTSSNPDGGQITNWPVTEEKKWLQVDSARPTGAYFIGFAIAVCRGASYEIICHDVTRYAPYRPACESLQMLTLNGCAFVC